MGLYEDLLERIRTVPQSAGFPAAIPSVAAPERDPWDLPRLSDLPQTMLPPHMRSHVGAVDASSPAVQAAIGNAPAGPAIPPSLAMHAAGMIPLDQANSPFTTPAGRAMMGGVGVDAPTVPMPRARPGEAPAAIAPDDGSSPVPASMAQPGPSDISARSRGPLQIAPQMAAVAPVAAGPAGDPAGLPSILDRLRTGLSDHSNTLLAIGAGFAGAPTFGQGISRAAAAAIPASAADLQQSLTRQTQGTGYQALVDAGVPKSLAKAALGNPAIMKSVTENYLGDRKGQLVDIGFDRYGQPIKGIFDPYTKKITPVASAVTPMAGGSGGTDVAGTGTATDISAAKAGAPNPISVGAGAPVTAENDITGPDYLQRLKETDPAYARQVEQVINGDAAMPTGRQAQTPMGRKLRQDVLTVEPGASDSDFSTRQKTQQSYTSGNDAKVTKSINTTLHHAETLERAINDLDNFSTLPAVLNPIRSTIKGQYDQKYQKAKGQYETAVANFAKELDFAVSGGRPTVSGTKHQMEGFSLNAPKVEQLAKLQEGVDLLKGRLESHAEGYNKGRRTARSPTDFIDPVNRKFYQRVLGEGGATVGDVPSQEAAAPSPAVAAPAPGRYVFDPATGTLVPAK